MHQKANNLPIPLKIWVNNSIFYPQYVTYVKKIAKFTHTIKEKIGK